MEIVKKPTEINYGRKYAKGCEDYSIRVSVNKQKKIQINQMHTF